MARRLRLMAGSLPVQFDQLLSKKLPASNAPLVVCESNIGLKGMHLWLIYVTLAVRLLREL